MHRNQIILVAACVSIIALLYFFGQRSLPKAAPENVLTMQQGEAANPSISTIQTNLDFNQLAENLKAKLPSTQADSINLLQTQLNETDDVAKKAQILQQVTDIWEKARYFEIASVFYKKMASNDSTVTNWAKAADKMEEASSISSDSTMRLFLLENAIVAYEKAIAMDTTRNDLKVELAATRLNGYPNESGQVMQSVFMLRDVAEQDSTNIQANLMLGKMSIVSGQFDKAVERLKRVIRHDKENTEAYYLLAEAYLSLENKEKAIEALKECKKLIKSPTFADEIDKYINKILNL